jgi:cyclophilin family peptidyl-prolyl cis-trans isomerase
MLIPEEANRIRTQLLQAANPVARAAAIEDLPTAPEDLEGLAHRCFLDADMESALAFIQSLDRWKLSHERQQSLLGAFLLHPDWGWRYQAYLQLRKVDPNAVWPGAPARRPGDSALLQEAQRLATSGKALRLRITFNGGRAITLKLDPKVAPLNVANLKRLAEQKFFDGRIVPRVVPDFVVQLGSPYDTMDGGPGYTVRCENSLDWYGPGSVGMALSGKDTGGSQFFITTNATPHLTGRYTRLGTVENLAHAMPLLDDLELGAKILSIRVVR